MSEKNFDILFNSLVEDRVFLHVTRDVKDDVFTIEATDLTGVDYSITWDKSKGELLSYTVNGEVFTDIIPEVLSMVSGYAEFNIINLSKPIIKNEYLSVPFMDYIKSINDYINEPLDEESIQTIYNDFKNSKELV